MSVSPPGFDFWGLIVAIGISCVSGFISISRRVLGGAPHTALWIITEFVTAIFCGYLMYEAYPALAPWLPGWCTLPIAVAFTAHSGGRLFQEMENTLITRFALFDRRKPPE